MTRGDQLGGTDVVTAICLALDDVDIERHSKRKPVTPFFQRNRLVLDRWARVISRLRPFESLRATPSQGSQMAESKGGKQREKERDGVLR